MTAALTPDELDAIALFPLPRVVWFPATRLPLHVFEARYRRMIADCLEQGRLVLAVTQIRPEWKGDYAGQPPIQEISGAGRITRHRRNPDGTYDIDLLGVSRVRLRELDPAELPYRRAHAELLGDRHPDGGVKRAELGALWSLASQIGQQVQRIDGRFSLRATPTDPPAILADRIADQLVTEPDVRQQLLETLDVEKRVELVRVHLARLHLALLATEGASARTLH